MKQAHEYNSMTYFIVYVSCAGMLEKSRLESVCLHKWLNHFPYLHHHLLAASVASVARVEVDGKD